MLELRSLRTGYGAVTVVHGIDLQVRAGEIVALIGANGAGKSTILKAISGVLPVKGEVLLDGDRIEQASPRRRVERGIAHVPEGRQVFSGLTVAENLRLGAYSGRRLGEAALAARIDEMCLHFPILLERLHEPAANLSGGQQQMLAIARGLMAAPRFLLLDEPSLGLSPVLVSDVFRLIAALRERGLGILLAEQNARMSLAIADRGYVVETGRIALHGAGRELAAQPEVAERYLGIGRATQAADAERHRRLVSRLRAILRP
jgi:branched-chain amino acid transport system ATP-binding protein